ncbi:MAG: phosphate ABC transporter permease PstA, partial [Proteobacteria bacterium]|nr:phosphate ABC transporter permease PstA [Pseudomonadota bacterium]
MNESAKTNLSGKGAGAADAVKRGLKRRYAAEARFKAYGIAAVAFALSALAILFATIVASGASTFRETVIQIEIQLTQDVIDPTGARDHGTLATANYQALVNAALRELFPDVKSRADRRDLSALISRGAAFQLQKLVIADPSLIGRKVSVTVPAASDLDLYAKGVYSRSTSSSDSRVNEKQMTWFDEMKKRGVVSTRFNTTFFTAADSREPELAGILGAAVGSLLTMLVTLALSFPIGVAAAVYLEEFAPKNRITQVIEVNINNLAAVPSIVFGLLGLAVFLNFFGLPRSAPLVGGVVLALITLPTIIIAGRAALSAVPPSIREAALGLGASRMQVVGHHVLPLAMPGMLTGAIIGTARALGETAPLLMIGMVAFIVDIPASITDPATVLPVHVYLWADSPER